MAPPSHLIPSSSSPPSLHKQNIPLTAMVEGGYQIIVRCTQECFPFIKTIISKKKNFMYFLMLHWVSLFNFAVLFHRSVLSLFCFTMKSYSTCFRFGKSSDFFISFSFCGCCAMPTEARMNYFKLKSFNVNFKPTYNLVMQT